MAELFLVLKESAERIAKHSERLQFCKSCETAYEAIKDMLMGNTGGMPVRITVINVEHLTLSCPTNIGDIIKEGGTKISIN